MAYFKIFQPSPELAGIVDFYWRSVMTLGERLEQDVPTPLMQGMTFNLSGMAEDMLFEKKKLHMNKYCYLFGQPAGPRISVSNVNGIDILGVKLKPTGIHRLTGLDMREVADDIIEADSIWGRDVELLCERLYESDTAGEMIWVLENFLRKKLEKRKKDSRNRTLEFALEYLHTGRAYSLEEIRMLTHTTKKTLERYFVNQVGLSPKRYARICRFNLIKNIFDQNPAADWRETAYKLGYYDQSHFIKEFREFSGKTPHEYCSSRLGEPAGLF